MGFVLPILTVAAAPDQQTNRAQSALAWFIIVIAVLGVCMIGLILLMAAQRARRRQEKPKEDEPQPDPWKVAAERLQSPTSEPGEDLRN